MTFFITPRIAQARPLLCSEDPGGVPVGVQVRNETDRVTLISHNVSISDWSRSWHWLQWFLLEMFAWSTRVLGWMCWYFFVCFPSGISPCLWDGRCYSLHFIFCSVTSFVQMFWDLNRSANMTKWALKTWGPSSCTAAHSGLLLSPSCMVTFHLFSAP